MNIGVMIALVVIAEAFLHYFPWRRVLRGRDLPRVVVYALGVLGLMLPFTFWLIEMGEIETIRILWLVIISGGIAVISLYGLDHVIELEWKVKEGAEREIQLKEQIRGQGK